MIVKSVIYSLYLCKTTRNAIGMTVMVSCKNQNSSYQLIHGPITVPPQMRDRPLHRGLDPLLFTKSVRVL